VPQSVAIIASDLMFQSQIEAAVRALGLTPVVADSPAAAERLAPRGHRLVVIDLHERSLEGLRAVRRAAAAGGRVLAFGRHTEPQLLRDARDAGAAAAVPRSELLATLPRCSVRAPLHKHEVRAP
jgi:DNA-binding NarL/FixJ family response regulator